MRYIQLFDENADELLSFDRDGFVRTWDGERRSVKPIGLLVEFELTEEQSNVAGDSKYLYNVRRFVSEWESVDGDD